MAFSSNSYGSYPFARYTAAGGQFAPLSTSSSQRTQTASSISTPQAFASRASVQAPSYKLMPSISYQLPPTSSSSHIPNQQNGNLYASTDSTNPPPMNNVQVNGNTSAPLVLTESMYSALSSRTGVDVSRLKTSLSAEYRIGSLNKADIVGILRYLREKNQYTGGLTFNKPVLIQQLARLLFGNPTESSPSSSTTSPRNNVPKNHSAPLTGKPPTPYIKTNFDLHVKKSPFHANAIEIFLQTIFSQRQQDAPSPDLHVVLFNIPMVNFEPLFRGEQTFDSTKMKHAIQLCLANAQGYPIAADLIKNSLIEIKIAGRQLRWDPTRMKKDDHVFDLTSLLPLQNLHDNITHYRAQTRGMNVLPLYIRGPRHLIDRGFVLLQVVDKYTAYDLAAQVYINVCARLNIYQQHRQSLSRITTAPERVKYLRKAIADYAAAIGENTRVNGNNNANDDDEIIVGDQQISLMCPLSLTRINHPAKSTYCTHRECFDLISFLQVNERNKSWKCGVCAKEVRLDALEIDTTFMNWLVKYPNDEKIVLHADGKTTAFNAPGKETPTHGEKRKRSESLESDSSQKRYKVKMEERDSEDREIEQREREEINLVSDDYPQTPRRPSHVERLLRRSSRGTPQNQRTPSQVVSLPSSSPFLNGIRSYLSYNGKNTGSSLSSGDGHHDIIVEKGDDGREREVIVLDDDD